MNQITARLNSMSANQIKDIVAALMDDFREGTDMVVDAALAVLERKIPSDQFVAFCDSL